MDRGDIYHVHLDPAEAKEARGRYVFIVSPREFNRLAAPLVCPIKQGGDFARHRGFVVSLNGATRTQGVVLCNQPRVLNVTARQCSFAEKAPLAVVDEVIAKLSTLLE
jgi:mRNA-degrading endonuclease toxin of MazEF toxin-antitoxin module